MKLQFDANQQFQLDAVAAVTEAPYSPLDLAHRFRRGDFDAAAVHATTGRGGYMASGAFIRGLGFGLAGAVILGVVLRDLAPVAVGMAVLGVVAGLVDANRPALMGLLAGQLAAFAVLMAIEFGTKLGTFINSGSVDEFLGLWPLVALIWLAFLGCGAVGFIVGSRVGVMRRARS